MTNVSGYAPHYGYYERAQARSAEHNAALKTLRNDPSGSLHARQSPPTVRFMRTRADFERLQQEHSARKKAWVTHTLTRRELGSVWAPIGVSGNLDDPWRRPNGTIVGPDDNVTVVRELKVREDTRFVHPRPVTTDDGDTIAIFPAELYDQLIPKKQQTITARQEYKDYDALLGNRAGVNGSTLKTYRGRVAHRFRALFCGAGDGAGDPRFNGKILFNLSVISVGISATLYALLYLSDYAETRHSELHEKQKRDQLALLAPQASTVSLNA